MKSLGRFLQMGALAIPPLAMIGQLSGGWSTGKMLTFLAMAVGIFVLGYTMQRYSR